MARYADYCPIAVGVEVLGDRWTPLVIRELMVGASGFNEIHRGHPPDQPDPARAAAPAARTARPGPPRARRPAAGRDVTALTPAGESVTPIVWAIGHWAAEWIFGDPAEEDCDGLSLMWRLHQHANPTKLPRQRTVVHLTLTGAGAAEGWLDIEHGAITVCKDDPGYDVDLAIDGRHRADAALAGRARPVPRPARRRPRPPARPEPAGPGVPDLVRHHLLR